MSMTKCTLLAVVLAFTSLAALAQKGGKNICKNLAGHITLEDAAGGIRSDGLGPYVDGQSGVAVTLFNCSGATGDAVVDVLGQTSRRLVRDFSVRIPVAGGDDLSPVWLATTPVQGAHGGLNLRHIFRSYDAATGYAQGYPVASCWSGAVPTATCEFTTVAASNIVASDGKTYYLRFMNPNPDIANPADPTLVELLNGGYENSLVRVLYLPNPTDHRGDVWVVEPLSTPAGFVGALYEAKRGSINRLGYFDMYFKATVRRKDGM